TLERGFSGRAFVAWIQLDCSRPFIKVHTSELSSALQLVLEEEKMPAPGAREGIILVADDNDANRDLLVGLLGGEGYHVLSVTDGKQALERIGRDPIDLALLDVVMPGQTGLDVCLAIKSKPETRLIPVVLLTSLTGDDVRMRSEERRVGKEC